MTPKATPPHDITGLLAAVREGAPDAMQQLMARVYDDLRRIAHRQLGAEDAGHTLDTTGLVHEAYLRLADQRNVPSADRVQFFAIAARMMRRVLVDYARMHRAARRGGGRRPLPLDAIAAADTDARGNASWQPATAERAEELIALDQALERLAHDDARMATVVELRFFAGLTEGEIASVLDVTERTVRRDWSRARERLYAEVRHGVR
jgi:RNA polymerase sigma factor (TIGR02999 family)